MAKTLIHGGHVRIPDNERLIRQLKEVEVRPTSGGGMSVSSPTWRTGGHGDIVSALVLALYRLGGFEVDDEAESKSKDDEEVEARIRKLEKDRSLQWWETSSPVDLDQWLEST
jgi:hypothetical protein